ncbi:MAG: glutamate--tRNA ligase [Bacteroidota bacterium]
MRHTEVRVRFAPSPTGPLHIGGVRTALYNYLFAKQHRGSVLLRIEDTDQKRFVRGAEDYIIDALNWCGIHFDEGVHVGGEYGPYRQSERQRIYQEKIQALLEQDWAYIAFDTPEELERMRERFRQKGEHNTQYDAHTRLEMRNSLTMSPDELKELMQQEIPYVIRFKMPENKEVKFGDLIRGNMTVNTSTLDDKVLMKTDGMPTYHLANIVDDHLMKITHVIRGEEWLPSLPLHVLLYEAFGWEKPLFAHLPLLLKPEGKGKLSKRDGDRMGFPVFATQWKDPDSGTLFKGFREEGYLPGAFVNIMGLLGWNPGTEQEIFSMEELMNSFQLEKVQKGGARFDPEKAKWFNHQYIQAMDNAELAAVYQQVVGEHGHHCDADKASRIVDMIKERVYLIPDFWEQSDFFFEAPEEFDPKSVKKKWKADTSDIMMAVKEILKDIDPFNADSIHSKLHAFIDHRELGFGKVMVPLRISVVGKAAGPDLMQLLEILGRDEVIRRMEYAVQHIQK